MFLAYLFQSTGRFAAWNRTKDLQRQTATMCLLTGARDARLRIFRGCAPVPFYTERESYNTEVPRFLRQFQFLESNDLP